jgi:hypothetical protein
MDARRRLVSNHQSTDESVNALLGRSAIDGLPRNPFEAAALPDDASDFVGAPPPPLGRSLENVDCVWTHWPLADQIRAAKSIIERTSRAGVGIHPRDIPPGQWGRPVPPSLFVDFTGRVLLWIEKTKSHRPLGHVPSRDDDWLADGSWFATLSQMVVVRSLFDKRYGHNTVPPPYALVEGIAAIRNWEHLPRIDRIVCLSTDWGDSLRHFLADEWAALKPGFYPAMRTRVIEGSPGSLPFWWTCEREPWDYLVLGAAADSRHFSRTRRVRPITSDIMRAGSARSYGRRGIATRKGKLS